MPATNYRSSKHQYRQSERIIGKFTTGSGATASFTRVSGSNQVSNNKISVGNLASSVAVVTFPKCRLATIVRLDVTVPTPSAALKVYAVADTEPNAAAGTVSVRFLSNTDADIAAALVAASVFTIVMDLAT